MYVTLVTISDYLKHNYFELLRIVKVRYTVLFLFTEYRKSGSRHGYGEYLELRLLATLLNVPTFYAYEQNSQPCQSVTV